MNSQDDVYSPLWVTHLARYSGIQRLTTTLGYPSIGPYLFALALLVVDFGVLSTIGSVTAGRVHPLLENPFLYITPFGLWFCIWIIRELAQTSEELANTYDAEMFERINTQEGFFDIRTSKTKYGIFSLIIIVHVINYVLLGGWEHVVEFEGPIIGFLKFGIIIPVGYFPIIAELVGLVIAIFIMVPRFFIKKRYQLQFDDPLNIGGLNQVGDAIKKSFYAYATGLVILLSWGYGPHVFSILATTSYPPPGELRVLQYILAWVLGIALLLSGAFTLHFYMQRQKREKIREIDARIRDLGSDPNGVPGKQVTEQEKSQLEIEYLNLEEVRKTKTWPFSPEAQERVLFSALFPIFLERFINIILI